jgi:AbrB family looped-hinge helix DNA binding protein
MPPFAEEFYGSVTVNEKGQVVIPADARKSLDINPGDKLLVMSGPHKSGLVMVKPEVMMEMANKLESGKAKIDKMINEDKNARE